MSKEKVSLEEGSFLNGGKIPYRVEKVIGSGGFGITYLVMGEIVQGNIPTEARFAIKEHFPSEFCERKGTEVVPKENLATDYMESLEDFIAEAEKLHKLGTKNNNIVKVNEVFKANGTAYYVMQYINGESLTNFVNNFNKDDSDSSSKGKLPYEVAVEILNPIANAVSFLHESRINHLDIKPDNIMLHHSGSEITPILIDFGLSVRFRKNGSKTSPKSVQGVSEGFSPIEQYDEITEFSPETDIYALAATLIYCLTGSKPKKASLLKSADIRKDLEGTIDQEHIEGLIKALSYSKENRTNDIAVFKSDLGFPVDDSSDTVKIKKKKKEETVKPSNNERLKLFFYGIGAACIVGIALFFIFTFSGGDSSRQQTATTEVPAVTASEGNVNKNEGKEDNSGENRQSSANETKPDKNNSSEVQSNNIQSQQTGSNANSSSLNNQNIAAISQSGTQVSSQPQPPKPQPATPSVSSSNQNRTSGTLNFSYGTWNGSISNGKPDGSGRFNFTGSHRLGSCTAAPGNYLLGTYDNGELVSGRLYDADGTLIQTIIP